MTSELRADGEHSGKQVVISSRSGTVFAAINSIFYVIPHIYSSIISAKYLNLHNLNNESLSKKLIVGKVV